MNEEYVIFATKGNKKFYVSNTEPFIWAPSLDSAKVYSTRFGAEYEVLRKYENYLSLEGQLRNRTIDQVFVAKIVNSEEAESYRIL